MNDGKHNDDLPPYVHSIGWPPKPLHDWHDWYERQRQAARQAALDRAMADAVMGRDRDDWGAR